MLPDATCSLVDGWVPLSGPHPPPLKPYVRFSRIRLNGGLHGQRALLWVTNRPEHPVQALVPKPLLRPFLHLSGTKVPAAPLHHEIAKAAVDVRVHLVELVGSVPSTKVVAPASEQGIEPFDDF